MAVLCYYVAGLGEVDGLAVIIVSIYERIAGVILLNFIRRAAVI